MSYSVHNFQTGDTINASDINTMDSAIKAHNDILYTVNHWNLCEDGETLYNIYINPSSQTVGSSIVQTNASGFFVSKVSVIGGKKYYFLSEGTSRVYPSSTGYNGGITSRFICWADKNDRFISGLAYPKPSTNTDELLAPDNACYLYITYYSKNEGLVTEDNCGWFWCTEKNENDHNDTEISSLIEITNWNLFDNEDSTEYLKIAVKNTDQTVGQTVVKSSASTYRTIRVNVEGLVGVYFLSVQSNHYTGTGYNGGNASRFACYTDNTDKVISVYTYPKPNMQDYLPSGVSVVPTGAKWLYVTDVTVDERAVADDRSNLADIWVTTHKENDHKNIEENRIDYLANLISAGSNSSKSNGISDVQTVRKPTFIFTFDDGTDGDLNTKALFDNYGFKCGFALLSYTTNTRYKDWQNEGYEVLSHSIDATAFSTITDDDVAETKLKNSLIELKGRGYDVVGWVTPSSVIKSSQVERLKKYYQFGFGSVQGGTSEIIHTLRGADIRQLQRWSLESNTITDTMTKIDECISSGGLMCFYGHSFPSTENNMTTENMTTILNYLKSKVDDEQIYVLPPRQAINNYYQFRWSDLVGLD